MVPIDQGTPSTSHQRGTVIHLNPEEVSLQAALAGGQVNPNTSTTGKYRGQNPGREEDCSASVETKDWKDRRTIGHTVSTLEGTDKGGDQGKYPESNIGKNW